MIKPALITPAILRVFGFPDDEIIKLERWKIIPCTLPEFTLIEFANLTAEMKTLRSSKWELDKLAMFIQQHVGTDVQYLDNGAGWMLTRYIGRREAHKRTGDELYQVDYLNADGYRIKTNIVNKTTKATTTVYTAKFGEHGILEEAISGTRCNIMEDMHAVIEVVNTVKKTFTYSMGKLIKVVYGNLNQTNLAYDLNGRVKESTKHTFAIEGKSPDTVTMTVYDYDDKGNIVKIEAHTQTKADFVGAKESMADASAESVAGAQNGFSQAFVEKVEMEYVYEDDKIVKEVAHFFDPDESADMIDFTQFWAGRETALAKDNEYREWAEQRLEDEELEIAKREANTKVTVNDKTKK